MKVFLILAIFVAISTAHHTPQHRTIDTDTNNDTDTDTTIPDDTEEEQDTDQGETETPKNVESRHHNPQLSSTSQSVPVLIPYPVLRSTPAYYHQPIQYVPILHEYPTARQGVGGGASAHLGPLSGGFGAGAGTQGLGGEFNLGLGSLGGVNANAGAGTGGLGAGFNLDLGSFGGVNANADLTPTVLVTPTPNAGYTKYYTKYYTPTRWYTGNSRPNRYYTTVVETAKPSAYPIQSLASSAPATPPYARAHQPQGVLIPMYY